MKTLFNTCIILNLSLLGGILVGGTAHAQRAKSTPSSGVVLPAFAPQRVTPGRDRFLNEPVLTTEALVEALKTNKTFRANIAKHFKLPEDRLIQFVEDALVPYILPKDTLVNNFGVTKSGMIYGKKMTLKKGTRVWATRKGDPILKWICSNPLLYVPPVLRKPPTTTTDLSLKKPSGINPVVAQLQPPPGIPGLSGGQVAINTPPTPFPIPTPRPTPPPTPRPTPKPTPPPRKRIARTGLPLLPLAGVVGGLVRSVPEPKSAPEIVLDETVGGGTQTATQRSSINSVPEPGSLVLAALGLLGLPLLRRRK